MGDTASVTDGDRTPRPGTSRLQSDPGFLTSCWPSVQGLLHRFRRSNELPLYNNKALQLRKRVTVSDMTRMRKETYRVRSWYLNKEMYLEAAVLSVWLTQHRVLLIQGGAGNMRRRQLACASFRKDISGKWCQPTGDLLIFPGLSQNLDFFKEALLDLKEAMSVLTRLDSRVSLNTAVKLSPYQITKEYLGDSMIPARLRAPQETPMVLVFRPIFTNKYYDMGFPKSRILVEILQSSAMVFIKMTDWALETLEIGAALCFVQNLQNYVSYLYNMLPEDEGLKDCYTYTMTQWLVAKTYYEIYANWNNITVIKRGYENLKSKMTDLVKYVFPEGRNLRKIFPCEPSTEFPRDRTEILERCYFTYNEISVPTSFRKSTYQKETVQVLHLTALLKDWADGFINPVNDNHLNLTFKFTLEDIYNEIERLRGLKEVSFDFKVMTNVLASKYSRYHIASRSCVLVNGDGGTSYAIEAERVCTKYHDLVQQAALNMFNDEYVDMICSEEFRSALIKTAVRSLADEVVYGIDKLNHDPRADSATALIKLMQKVVHIWFRAFARIDRRTRRIPREEVKEFEYVMAMFLFGLASMHLLQHQETDEGQHLENSQYVFALAWQYLMRDTVAHRVLSAFVEHALMAECFFLVPSKKKIWNKSKHSFAVMRRLVRLLPIFYELCIHSGITSGPEDYHQVTVRISKYPLPISMFGPGGQPGRAANKKLLNYVLTDLDARTDEPFQAQNAEERSNEPGNTCTYRSVHARRRNLRFDTSLDEDIPYVPRIFSAPPLLGKGFCDQTKSPMNDYLDDKFLFTPVERFGEEFFGRLFTDYDDSTPELTNDYNPLLVKIKSLLNRVIDVASEDLQDIVNSSDTEKRTVYITTTKAAIPYGENNSHSPAFIRSELLVLLDNLNQEDCPPLLCITRTLYRLDSLLNEGHLRPLLRGRLNLGDNKRVILPTLSELFNAPFCFSRGLDTYL